MPLLFLYGAWFIHSLNLDIIFPIKTISGRTVGFGARVLQSSLKTAKYINSPDSIIYNKSKILYGLYKSKTQIVKNDNCYIVEGYTDVIRFHQKGIPNVVSSSGTALTLGQINIIRRLTKNITMLFDSDNAGLNATIRSIDMILSEGMNVSICLFPENEDPDSFARNKNTQEFDVNELIIMKSDVFHLDTLFTPVINKKNELAAMIACTELMEKESVDDLKSFSNKISVELVEVDPEDSIGTKDKLGEFAVNCCPLPGYLIGPTRFRSLKVNQLLKDLEVMHITIPTTQFRLSGGSVHCLTNEL